MKGLGIEVETLDEPLHVNSPLGIRVRINQICQDSELEILGILLMVDLRVIVDRLTKLAHFLVVRLTFTLEEFCRMYIREIVWLHRVSISIVSDKDPDLWHTFGRVSKRPWRHN